MHAVEAAITGAVVGGLYALMAAGLSITWGVLRVINLAHFALILVGAYLTYQASAVWGLDPLLSLVVSAPILFVLGAGLQWAYERFNIVEFNSLLVSFGLLMVAIEVVTRIWSADDRVLPANPYGGGSLALGSLHIPWAQLIGLGLAIVLVGGGHLVLRHTFAGRGLRAFAQDRQVAASFGIDHRRLGLLVGGLSGVTAAAAGLVFSLSQVVAPSHAYDWFGTVFVVVILGGIGNLLGCLLAGLVVGALSSVVGAVWNPGYAPLVLFLAIVVALVLRPAGLFTRKAAA